MARNEGRARWRNWVIGGVFGLLALAALVAGSISGNVQSQKLDPRLIGWISAGALLLFGAVSATRLSKVMAHHVATTSMPTAGGAVRIVSAAVGYLIVFFGVLALLQVSIEKLLVGAGLAGIVLGIAAQQSLGNVFAGIVLILAKPFRVGDRIRVRSGALGGIFDARVREMTLTYVTLQTDEGEYKVPNAGMLAAGVARTPRTPLPQPAAPAAPKQELAAGQAAPDSSKRAQDGTATTPSVPADGAGAAGRRSAASTVTPGPAAGGAPSGGAPGPV